MNMIKAKILDVHAKSANDFESLTDLYRQIFAFLMVHAGNDSLRQRRRARGCRCARVRVSAHRAESVHDDVARKEGQLKNSNIVLGIRSSIRTSARVGLVWTIFRAWQCLMSRSCRQAFSHRWMR